MFARSVVKFRKNNARLHGALLKFQSTSRTAQAVTIGSSHTDTSTANTFFYLFGGLILSLGASSDSKTHCSGNATFNKNFVVDVVSSVSPSVVNILCAVDGRGLRGTATGSGFVVSKDGFIVTNAHVVEQSRDGRVLVTMKNNKRLIGRVHSIDSASDIAMVKLESDLRNYPAVKLGSSSKLRAGDFVVSIGSPMSLQDSASFGIVSAVARHAAELGMSNNRSEYIQTDAAINQGNSGGPLVNMDGEVVGINSMTVQGSEGLSFAIPIDTASIIIKQLMEKGRVTRPYIGLKMAPVAEPNKRNPKMSMDIFDLRPSKVMVVEIFAGSPAEKAGLKVGDVIVEVDGRPVTVSRDVLERITMDIGQTLVFKVLRKNGSREDTLTMRLVTTAAAQK